MTGGDSADERADPYVLPAGGSRLTDAMIDFKATARDSGGSMSVSEFELSPWQSGPVLHLHTSVDEALYVLSGTLDVQLGEQRFFASAGDFVWMPRQVAHTFACAGDRAARALAVIVPGGLELLLQEQVRHLATAGDRPDPVVLHEIGERHGARTVGAAIVPRRPDGHGSASTVR